MNKLIDSHRWVIHTYKVIEATNNILLDVLDVQSAVRGYLISHDPKYLNTMDNETKNILNSYATVLNLTKDNPKQQQLLAILGPMLEERIKFFRNTLSTKTNNKTHSSETQNSLLLGQNLTNQIINTTHEIYDGEMKLLVEREEDAISSFNNASLLISVANIISLLFLIIVILLFNRILYNLKQSEISTKQSESLIKGIVNGTNDIVAALDLDYRFIIFNQAFASEFKRIFGKRVAIGMSMKDALMHLPKEQEKAIQLWKRALNGEEFTTISEFGSDKSTNTQYEISFSSIYDENNNLIGASHIVRDVSQRLKEENDLRQSKEDLEVAFHELKNKTGEMKLIHDMDNVLNSSLSMDETLNLTALNLKKLLPFSAGIIYLLNSSRNYLEARAEWNNPQAKEKVFSPNECWALKQGDIYFYMNNEEKLPCKHAEKEVIQSYCCVPLLAQNDVMGILYIELSNVQNMTENKKDFEQIFHKNLWLIRSLAGRISLSISNIKLNNSLKIRSTRDPLTNLYNRAYLNETLERDIYKAKRAKTIIAAIMMDVDFFKKVNDLYGHEAGDIILKEVSKLLINKIRHSDIACRYGGEEFLMIFYDTTLEDTLKRAEELRKSISELQFNFGGVSYSITASFGIAMYPEHSDDTPKKLIKAADLALYQSKQNGRDRITVYQKSIDLES